MNYHTEIDQVDDGGGQATTYSERKAGNVSAVLDVEEYEERLRFLEDSAHSESYSENNSEARQIFSRGESFGYKGAIKLLKDMVDIEGWRRAHTQKAAKEGGTNGG